MSDKKEPEKIPMEDYFTDPLAWNFNQIAGEVIGGKKTPDAPAKKLAKPIRAETVFAEDPEAHNVEVFDAKGNEVPNVAYVDLDRGVLFKWISVTRDEFLNPAREEMLMVRGKFTIRHK